MPENKAVFLAVQFNICKKAPSQHRQTHRLGFTHRLTFNSEVQKKDFFYQGCYQTKVFAITCPLSPAPLPQLCSGVQHVTPRLAAAKPLPACTHTKEKKHKCELHSLHTLTQVLKCALLTTPGLQTWHTFLMSTLLSPLHGSFSNSRKMKSNLSPPPSRLVQSCS